MKQFNNILVVVTGDGDPGNNPALMRGMELAAKSRGRLTLMDVVSPPKRTISQYKGIFKPGEITDMLVAEREQALSEVAGQLRERVDGAIAISVKVVVGRDFIEIVRQVILAKHDLLIKVANEHPGSFDSSDFHLMRKCPQPVWLLKSKHQGRGGKMLAAVDLSLEDNAEGKALNTLIMDLAAALAQWQGSELHVLSCWSLYAEKSLRDSAFLKISADELNRLLTAEEQANRNLQNALTARYTGLAIHNHLIKGDPVEHIPAFARRQAVDVVVMGTVARSGIPGFLIGNTAETILHVIDSSVITLKPGGFESPIN